MNRNLNVLCVLAVPLILVLCAFPLQAENLLDVTWMGVMGDGVTDDTANLQAAIDMADSSGSIDGIYIPGGIYITSEPLRLCSDMIVRGDSGRTNSVILSSATAALVCWEGTWNGATVDYDEVWTIAQKECGNVTLDDLRIYCTGDYALHTLGVASNGMHITNCWFTGQVASFVSTGFFNDCLLENSKFSRTTKILAEDATVLPTVNGTTFRDCLFGTSGIQYGDWRIVLKGAIQNTTFKNITFEATWNCILLDAYRDGTGNVFDGLWNFDAHVPTGHNVVIRVEAADGLRISNVMGLDSTSDIVLVNNGSVNNVYLQSILAHLITNGVSVTAYNCPL